jgi:xanthine dehydrogenase YagR molybdenum-binding subunit
VTGKAVSRIEGRQKVTGQAKYSADMPTKNLAYAYVAQSTIARGTIKSIDSQAAEQLPGVLAVITHANAPRVKTSQAKMSSLLLMQDNKVLHAGQHVAVVVAETFETARQAAGLLRVEYKEEKPRTDLKEKAPPDTVVGVGDDLKRGDAERAFRSATVVVDETYSTPTENHNPLEPFATIASWHGDKLTLYETTQGVFPSRDAFAAVLGIPAENVRVITHFLGGGFGSKLNTWSHAILAALAAKQVKRPVKLVLARTQMYGPVGFRPATVQKVTLGASKEGKLVAIKHTGLSETSRSNDFEESVTEGTRILYDCPNVTTSLKVARLDIGNPTWMRAPGHVTGSFALESAIDELAWALKMDPIELRRVNYAEKDPDTGRPWSSKSLKECYGRGAELFGWQNRTASPRSMRKGDKLLGMGMATALHGTYRATASAITRMLPDGSVQVQAGTQDIGTGTYTFMAQLAADALAVPISKVTVELGDTDLPPTPLSGGSMTAASVGSAVHLSALALVDKLKQLASQDKQSPLYKVPAEDIVTEGSALKQKGSSETAETYERLLVRNKVAALEGKAKAAPGSEEKKYSMHAFGAQFAEVEVDPELGSVHVTRLLGAFGAGRILNAKTARSQMIGGMIMGMGMAMFEETVIDHNLGRIVNNDLAEYHIPVHADMPHFEVLFVEEHDPYINPIGAKGVGELGITGVAAAIANAIYHATGKRIRDLPITLDKILDV